MVKASPCRDECTDLHPDCPNLFSLIKLQSQGYQQNYLLSFASHRDGEQDSLYFYVNCCNSGIIDLLQITISSAFACWIASLVRHTNSTSLVINPDLDPCQRMYKIAIFKSWEFFLFKAFHDPASSNALKQKLQFNHCHHSERWKPAERSFILSPFLTLLKTAGTTINIGLVFWLLMNTQSTHSITGCVSSKRGLHAFFHRPYLVRFMNKLVIISVKKTSKTN